jgi:hypothetical protein
MAGSNSNAMTRPPDPADFQAADALLSRLHRDTVEAIKSEPGELVLLPSHLYHGIRPFSAGERMSAAFDVLAAGAGG